MDAEADTSVGMGDVDVSLAEGVNMGMGACIGGEDLDVVGDGLEEGRYLSSREGRTMS